MGRAASPEVATRSLKRFVKSTARQPTTVGLTAGELVIGAGGRQQTAVPKGPGRSVMLTAVSVISGIGEVVVVVVTRRFGGIFARYRCGLVRFCQGSAQLGLKVPTRPEKSSYAVWFRWPMIHFPESPRAVEDNRNVGPYRLRIL